MLDNAYKLNNNLLRVILLRMPREIQLSIFEQPVLTTADKICLALTCKSCARALSSDPKLSTHPEKLKHGDEDYVREVFLDKNCPDHDASESDLDAWVATRKKVDRDFRKCIDPYEVTGLLRRLDKGWNRSSLRVCLTCEKFVSTEQSYWDKRDIFYSYKSNNSVAEAWRKGICSCGEHFENGADARGYAKTWVENGETCSICPPCKVLSWRRGDGRQCSLLLLLRSRVSSGRKVTVTRRIDVKVASARLSGTSGCRSFKYVSKLMFIGIETVEAQHFNMISIFSYDAYLPEDGTITVDGSCVSLYLDSSLFRLTIF